MVGPPRLQMGTCYHIFSRGINGENIFREERNYTFFLQRYAKYIEPVAYTYAYCLLGNHFHFLIRVKAEEEQRRDFEALHSPGGFRVLDPSQQFGNLLNAYAKAFNRTYGRTGSLFVHPFGRIAVDRDAYFRQLVAYIHRNPETHGLVDDFRTWPFSSYRALLSAKPTRLRREEVLAWFGGRKAFEAYHRVAVDTGKIAAWLPDEDL